VAAERRKRVAIAKVSTGLEIYYEEAGAGEPLLLIMGFGLDSRLWMLQVPAFSKHYRTITFDNRGAGRSAKPAGPYTIKGMAEDTRALLDHLGVASAHVLGLSMGGMIAQELALNHPESVKSLILACTYAKPDELVRGHMRSIVESVGGRILPDGRIEADPSSVDPMAIVQSMMPLILSADFLQANMNMLMEILSGSLQFGISVEAIMAQAAAVASHNTDGRLGAISCPTLVLTGTADALISPESSDFIARQIPGAKLVKIEGGTHGFNCEMPDRCNEEVLAFLAGAANKRAKIEA